MDEEIWVDCANGHVSYCVDYIGDSIDTCDYLMKGVTIQNICNKEVIMCR